MPPFCRVYARCQCARLPLPARTWLFTTHALPPSSACRNASCTRTADARDLAQRLVCLWFGERDGAGRPRPHAALHAAARCPPAHPARARARNTRRPARPPRARRAGGRVAWRHTKTQPPPHLVRPGLSVIGQLWLWPLCIWLAYRSALFAGGHPPVCVDAGWYASWGQGRAGSWVPARGGWVGGCRGGWVAGCVAGWVRGWVVPCPPSPHPHTCTRTCKSARPAPSPPPLPPRAQALWHCMWRTHGAPACAPPPRRAPLRYAGARQPRAAHSPPGSPSTRSSPARRAQLGCDLARAPGGARAAACGRSVCAWPGTHLHASATSHPLGPGPHLGPAPPPPGGPSGG